MKLGKGHSLSLGIVWLMFLGSCTTQDQSYFPLQAGIEWRYQISLKASGAIEKQKYYVRNQGQRAIEDENFYVQRSLTGTEILYRVSDSGVERYGYIQSRNQPGEMKEDAMLLLPKSTEPGTEWENMMQTRLLIRKGAPGESAILAKVPATSEVESVDDTVVVPAGKFKNCIKITSKGFAFHSGTQHRGRTLVDIKETRWYAQGRGLVKSVRLETSTSDAFGTREQTIELESINLP